MSVFRIILVVLVGAVFLLLSVANWTMVPFLKPDGQSVQVPLPLIILGAFLAGWLPTWLSHIAARTVLRRKLERAERQLRELRGDAVDSAAAPVLHDGLPGQTQPTIVPRAGA